MIVTVVEVWATARYDAAELDCGHFVWLGESDESNDSLVGAEYDCRRHPD